MLTHSTNLPPGEIVHEWDLAVRPIKVEILDENKEFLNRVATGFYFSGENNECELYLPWHVVTGYNYPSVEVKDPPNRRYIRLISKRIVSAPPGHHGLGGTESTIIPLYSDHGEPMWIQEQLYLEHPDLKHYNIRIPRYTDLVALKVEMQSQKARFLCFTPQQTSSQSIQNGQEIVITGYPYGYSALGDASLEPIFVVRHIAAWVTKERPHDFLIDGVGAQGMSGSPIFIRKENGFKLIGVYTGSVFPDAAETGRKQDIYSTIGTAIRFASREHFNKGIDYVLAPD